MENPTARRWSNLKRESVGTILWVRERANRGASTGRERKTDVETRVWRTSVENAWRTNHGAPRDLDTASGKSHRSVTEEQEGGKEQSTNYELPPRIPLRRFLWLLFFYFFIIFFRVFVSFAKINQIDSVLKRIPRFTIQNFQSKPWLTNNTKIHLRCRKLYFVRLIIHSISLRYNRPAFNCSIVFIVLHFFTLIYSELIFQCDIESTIAALGGEQLSIFRKYNRCRNEVSMKVQTTFIDRASRSVSLLSKVIDVSIVIIQSFFPSEFQQDAEMENSYNFFDLSIGLDSVNGTGRIHGEF